QQLGGVGRNRPRLVGVYGHVGLEALTLVGVQALASDEADAPRLILTDALQRLIERRQIGSADPRAAWLLLAADEGDVNRVAVADRAAEPGRQCVGLDHHFRRRWPARALE